MEPLHQAGARQLDYACQPWPLTQFTRQNSIGDELGGDFDTRSRGAKLATSYGGLVLSLARTSTSSNAGIQGHWGGKPSYLSLMPKDFDRADEDTWLVGLSSEFCYL